jgi:dTDP-4-dehydrorhamnose reductase
MQASAGWETERASDDGIERDVLAPLFRRSAARPKNSRLAGDRLRERFGIALPGWEEGWRYVWGRCGACAAA